MGHIVAVLVEKESKNVCWAKCCHKSHSDGIKWMWQFYGENIGRESNS